MTTFDPDRLHAHDEPLSVEKPYGVDMLLRRLREVHGEERENLERLIRAREQKSESAA